MISPVRILVAVDRSTGSQRAVEYVRALDLGGRSRISKEAPEVVIDAFWRDAVRMVDQAGSYLHARFPDVSTDVSVGAPAREIVDSARAWPADVIAVGSRNRHGSSRSR
ncbi:MAG TPA: universal stress protein [Chloroflexota bacterium]|nr:universal stress protein [Chloroflexota bacterium]